MRARLGGLVLLGLGVLGPAAAAQQVLVDRAVRVAGLWCFPLAADTSQYVFVPSEARLATDALGRPQFSFVRYVLNEPGATSGQATIAAARGGGVLHFLVAYATPSAQVEAARRALRDSVGGHVRLRGPIVFTEGRYALVSSVLTASGGGERTILATGRAPVLEGNRIALSFELDPARASLLLNSFAMATPDVSLVFDMAFTGLTEAYDAQLVVHWSEVRRSLGFEAGGSVYFVGADVEALFDEFRRTSAIELRSGGSDAAIEGLLAAVYDKLLTLMFRPVEPDQASEGERGNLLEAVSTLADGKRMSELSRGFTGFGLYAGYRVKDLRSEGTSVLSFNHRASVERHATIVFNIGDFHRRYGADPAYFRAVNLGDPTYQQREIHLAVDGALLPEFDRFINSVTVTLRKRHQNGQLTLRELVLGRQRVASDSGALRMVYGWNGDDDRAAWLGYEYRAQWSFRDGGSYKAPWMLTDASMINLYAPYERRRMQVLGDPETLQARRVRAVVVEVEYPFFEQRRKQQVVVRVGAGPAEREIELTVPRDEFAYDVTVTWHLEGGRRLVRRTRETSGLVFIDELPDEPAAMPTLREHF